MYTGTDDRRYQELLPEIPPSQPDLGLNFSLCLAHFFILGPKEPIWTNIPQPSLALEMQILILFIVVTTCSKNPLLCSWLC